jgi:probable addiction module antidote protein
MPKRTRDYRSWQLEKLENPRVAVSYLNAALRDSPKMFLKALRNVAQAHRVTRVAKEAGITRESVYRSFSEEGNPTLDTLNSVLTVFGLKLAIVEDSHTLAELPSSLRIEPPIGTDAGTAAYFNCILKYHLTSAVGRDFFVPAEPGIGKTHLLVSSFTGIGARVGGQIGSFCNQQFGPASQTQPDFGPSTTGTGHARFLGIEAQC